MVLYFIAKRNIENIFIQKKQNYFIIITDYENSLQKNCF